MRKLLFTICAVLGVLAIAGAALADGLCSVTVTADCKTVTIATHVPKGENGTTSETLTLLDNGDVHSFEFTGVDDTRTFDHPGDQAVPWDATGTVTVGELVKPFHFTGTAERSGECGEPSPSPSPTVPPTTPPSNPPKTTAPPLAFTGLPGPGWPLVWGLVAGGVLLLTFGLRRRRRA